MDFVECPRRECLVFTTGMEVTLVSLFFSFNLLNINHSSGRQIVDFIEKQLERNIAMELKVDDGSSTEERLTR
jgi:hypothetical protein